MMHISTVFYIASTALLLLAVQLAIGYRRAVRSIRNFRGYRYLFSPASDLASIIPFTIPYVVTGQLHAWERKHSDFVKYNSDIFSHVSACPRAQVYFKVADAAAIKEITTHRPLWPKPIELYELNNSFGHNIIDTEGNEWKKHRRVANPAFSEPNNKLVWDEAVRITLDMIDNVWKNEAEVVIEHGVDITLSLALLVIGSAGFGRKISFEDDLKVVGGHTVSFKEALNTVSKDLILGGIMPSWSLGLTARLRRYKVADRELRQYMQEMINERRTSEKKAEQYDLFGSLLDANADDSYGPKSRLSDGELIGNIFVFLLAGHETTAHTLCFTLGLLAIHQEEQDKLFKHIRSVLPDDRLPTYADMHSLDYCLAVFLETLRLFPPVNTIPKKAAEDTTLTTTNSDGEKIIVPIPKGAGIELYTTGLHYNPRYWEDPFEFRPKRFLQQNWPRDAFLPFSAGARSCIGRRFSETEATAILTILIARYKVEIKEEPRFAGETFEERKARILTAKAGLTLTPARVPLTFKRRY